MSSCPRVGEGRSAGADVVGERLELHSPLQLEVARIGWPPSVAIPAVLVIAGVGLPWYGGNRGLRDRPYLLNWLRTTLEVGRSQ